MSDNDGINLALLSDGIALAFPDLDLFISLSGAICMSVLSIITPALLDLTVLPQDSSQLIKLKNVFLVIFGIFISVYGTILSVQDLIQRHVHH